MGVPAEGREANQSDKYGFNLLFFKRFWRLHKIFFPGLFSLTSGLFALLLLTSALEQYLAYNIGLLAGKFFNVLGNKDFDEFKSVCILNVVIVIAISITISARVLSTRILSVGWRQTLCQVIHRLYMTNTNYYRLNVMDGVIDNPDQRISADVSSLVESYGGIISNLVVTPFTIAYYSYDAYTRAGWIGPTGMFLLFLVSTVVNKMLMRPMVRITVEKERKEGDFRFKHLQVRCNAESLAFHGSGALELAKVNNKLSEVCGVQQSLYYRNFVIDVSVNVFAYLGAIASYLVISVPIFSGAYDDLSGPELSQKISENAFVCMYLMSQLTKLVTITGTVAGMAGSTHRVSELLERLVNLTQDDEDGGRNTANLAGVVVEQDTNSDSDPDLVWLSSFCLTAPSASYSTGQNKPLIRNLDLLVRKGRNLLVMGPSSSGKSSLLRTLRGIWAQSSGDLKINRHSSTFFIPQKPYFTNGTLREQMTYPLLVIPGLVDQSEEKTLRDLLQITGLEGLVDRCGGMDIEPTWSWYDILSPGEQQRLAFTRLLFHEPVLAVLDEATSALSQDIEKKLYETCLARGITLLSVGHRESLKQFHHQMLYLTGVEGGWTLTDLAQSGT